MKTDLAKNFGPRRKAKGYKRNGRNPKVSVTWPEDMFNTINARAGKEGKTFARMVRELCAEALKG